MERAPMRVYGMLLGALLAAAAMTTSVGVAPGESFDHHQRRHRSRPTSRKLRRPDLSLYRGRYTRRSLSRRADCWLERACGGRTTVPYQVIFHIVAPEAASDADTVVVEAPNRGRTIFPGAISVPAPVTGPSADPAASAIGDGFLLSHGFPSPQSNGKRGLPPACPRARKGSEKLSSEISAAGLAAHSEVGRLPCQSSAIVSWPA